MTKKDYELIESAFLDRRDITNDSVEAGAYTEAEFNFAHHCIDMLAVDMSVKLKENDPKFDQSKFLRYTGTPIAND